jgi:hypothetical protein
MRSHSTEHYGEKAYERASDGADLMTAPVVMSAHRS